MADDEVARAVALAWGVAAAPQRGPKRELSHERIVEAAIEIADAEGLPAVTMQRVAQRFGFTTMAMYRYVATKDDLHSLMVDAAAGDHVVPVDADDWRTGLEQWSRWLVEVYAKHPWVLDIPLSSEALLMPAQMRGADAAMRAMRTLPASSDEKLGVLMLLSTVVRGFGVIARDITTGGETLSEATKALVRQVATNGHLPDIAGLVECGAYFGETSDGVQDDDDLGIGLALILAGIESEFADREPIAEQQVHRTPEQELAAAEAELRACIAARKATQRRAGELERREGALRAARDRAKAAAKLAAKQAAKAADR